MKKVMLGLVMVVMLMSLVGCGETKKEGFEPDQVTESEVVTEDTKENIEEIANGDLTKYYDTEKFIGTPKLVTLTVAKVEDNVATLFASVGDGFYSIKIENTKNFKFKEQYKCIVCDNGTSDNYLDDVIAYIFTE